MVAFLMSYTTGICFEDGQSVKLNASHRDLLLILGIVVAIIISITTWLHDTNQKSSQITPLLSPKVNSSLVVKKLGQVVFELTAQVKSGVFHRLE